MKYTLTDKQVEAFKRITAQAQAAQAAFQSEQQKIQAFLTGLGYEAKDGEQCNVNLEGNELEIK
ncbi:MAG TPA: hypothetical protein PK059_02120 [Cyclobacteriaceae bacterium]|nr:hypothetical protein [Cyclobacteriaceae bacterium]